MTLLDIFHAPARELRPAPRADFAPTPLLAFLAGEHAPALARVWPAPHAEYLALPTAHRHLAAIALIHWFGDDAARLARLFETRPLRDLVGVVLQAPPRGLGRALSHLGEALWRGAEYAALLRLLREPAAATVLRHAEAIDLALVAKLEALTPALRKPRIVAQLPTPDAAITLREAFHAARTINPRRPERDLVLALERAKDRRRLFETAIGAMKPDRFGDIAAAPAMKRPYRAITSRAALETEALRFRNCVASYGWEIGAGAMAVYVVEDETAVMIALKRDVGGWRLAEALGYENAVIEEALLRTIASDFAAAGVWVGQPIRAIEDRLETLAEAVDPQPAPALTYAAQIGLGQLWR